jgi:hypothetical protein
MTPQRRAQLSCVLALSATTAVAAAWIYLLSVLALDLARWMAR